MKVSVSFSCEVGNIEVDEKYRELCSVCATPEEDVKAQDLTDELIADLENQLSEIGFNVYSIDSIETYDGWLLYEEH